MEYFILKPNGEQTGTFFIEQIREMLKEGVIDSATKYWHEGITEWRPIDKIEESLNFQPPPPTASGKSSSKPPKRPATSREVPRPVPVTEKAHSPPVRPKKGPDVPYPILTLVQNEKESPSAADLPRAAEPAAKPIAQADRPKDKRILGWVYYAVSVILVALAIDYAAPVMHYASTLFQSKVTLTGDTYAVLDRATIKSFADDMRNFPAAEALQHQIEQAANPAARVSLRVGLEKARTWHTNEIQQRYLRSGKAEFIDPGIYPRLEYLDDKGDRTIPRDGKSVWIAITYKDHTVYAYQPPDSAPVPVAP